MHLRPTQIIQDILSPQDPSFNPICKIPFTVKGDTQGIQWLESGYLWGDYSAYHTHHFLPQPFQMLLKHFLSSGNFPYKLFSPIVTPNYSQPGTSVKDWLFGIGWGWVGSQDTGISVLKPDNCQVNQDVPVTLSPQIYSHITL